MIHCGFSIGFWRGLKEFIRIGDSRKVALKAIARDFFFSLSKVETFTHFEQKSKKRSSC